MTYMVRISSSKGITYEPLMEHNLSVDILRLRSIYRGDDRLMSFTSSFGGAMLLRFREGSRLTPSAVRIIDGYNIDTIVRLIEAPLVERRDLFVQWTFSGSIVMPCQFVEWRIDTKERKLYFSNEADLLKWKMSQ